MRASTGSGEPGAVELRKRVRPLRGRGRGTLGAGEGSDKRPDVKSLEYWWYCISTVVSGGGVCARRGTWGVKFIYKCEMASTSWDQ